VKAPKQEGAESRNGEGPDFLWSGGRDNMGGGGGGGEKRQVEKTSKRRERCLREWGQKLGAKKGWL